MYEQVRDYIIENKMIEPGDIVLAGVSGGGDSMAMLSILRRFREEVPFDLHAVHVHHGIRGQEADRDQEFVQEICSTWGIPCKAYAYPVPLLAQEWKVGTEEAARIVRRRAFQEERQRLGTGDVCVRTALAHNQDDLAETMLHHLARGTGIRGLSSMRPSAGEIIRPVLCLGKEEIVHYLKENNIPYLIDSTNLTDDYTRNRIRHHILPLIEKEINVKAAEHMAETARVLAQAEDYLSGQGRELLEKYKDDGEKYLFLPSFFGEEPVVMAYAVQQAFENLAGQRKDFTSFHVKMVLELEQKQTGRKVSLPYGLYAEKGYQGVILGKAESPVSSLAEPGFCEGKQDQEWEIPVPGVLDCPLGRFHAEIFSYEGQKIEEKKCTKWLDYDKIGYNLCARTRRTGDFLVVNREGNCKKLNRYMIDEKIPRDQRERIPLVVCSNEVLWMVGGRINERYKITSGTTRVLQLSYQGGNYHE
ncbi:MAG: tRNA lysidine(34) synthetase TilS [Eubacteriales bacterium]|nr:tRNA lysidine(34) synthetase TilS [Eubacteriales bacterium]